MNELLSTIKYSISMRLALLIFLAFLINSCSKTMPNNCSPDEYSYEFFTNKKIDTSQSTYGLYYEIKEGNSIVFKYTHKGPDCKNIADEEFSEFLVWQIPAGTLTFEFKNEQLIPASCYFNKVCFCPPSTYAVQKGIIKGTLKSSSKWRVEINVEINANGDKLFITRDFELK